MLTLPVSQKNQPCGLYLLTFSEFWDRFSYYGIQALLVLYVTKVFLFSDDQAYGLYGIFTALTFASTVVGGIVADRLIGFRRAVIMGIILLALGNMLLILPGQKSMYLGLALFICGIGFFKPSNASLVGTLYAAKDGRRESGFSIFYMAMNAGGLLGPLVYGYISQALGWRYGFAVSAVGAILALIVFLVKKDAFIEEKHSKPNLHSRLGIGLTIGQSFYLAIIGAVGLTILLLQYVKFFGSLLGIVGVSTILGLAAIALKSEAIERKRIIGLSILSFFCIFFFACSLQTATTLTLFIERDINRNILGLQLPTMMFLSLQPFFIILLAPLVAKLWAWLVNRNIDLSVPTKIAFGLFFAALSFASFSFAAVSRSNASYFPIIALLFGNLILGLGELCILPIVLSAITQLAPLRLRGTMMGVLFLAFAFSGYLAGAVAKMVSLGNSTHSGQGVTVNYAHAFIEVSLLTVVIGLIMLAINPWLKQTLQAEQSFQEAVAPS